MPRRHRHQTRNVNITKKNGEKFTAVYLGESKNGKSIRVSREGKTSWLQKANIGFEFVD